MNVLQHHPGTIQSRTRRRALTLVELAVAMTVVGVLFVLLSTVIVRLLRAESDTRGHPSQIHTLSQLSDRFRGDVRRAVQLSSRDDSEGPAWRIESMDDRTIEYAVESGQIQRTVLAGSELQSRNSYRLPPQALVDFQRFRVQDQPFARIRLQNADQSRVLLETVAQVGRDQRFSSNNSH